MGPASELAHRLRTHYSVVYKRVVFQKGGFGGCSPGTKTGKRVHLDVRPERNRNEGMFACSPRTNTGTRVHLDVPPERKPERGYVRMFPRNENRNEGTFAKTTLLRNRPFILQVNYGKEQPPSQNMTVPLPEPPAGWPTRVGCTRRALLVGPDPLQRCVGDGWPLHFGGFRWGLSWTVCLGTFSTKLRRIILVTKSARKSGGSKIEIGEKSVLPKADPRFFSLPSPPPVLPNKTQNTHEIPFTARWRWLGR